MAGVVVDALSSSEEGDQEGEKGELHFVFPLRQCWQDLRFVHVVLSGAKEVEGAEEGDQGGGAPAVPARRQCPEEGDV